LEIHNPGQLAVDHSWRAMEKTLGKRVGYYQRSRSLNGFIDNMAYLAAAETEVRVRQDFERGFLNWMLSRGKAEL